MGFLHLLWDETLAGPTPETGLGKLRKYDSFSARSSPSMVSNPNPEGITITRSITVLRKAPNPNRNDNHHPILSYDSSSSSSTPNSSSPATATSAPTTPRTPEGDYKRFTRRKFANEAFEHAEPTSSTIDWIVMSALDR